jgi:hypothetical protein
MKGQRGTTTNSNPRGESTSILRQQPQLNNVVTTRRVRFTLLSCVLYPSVNTSQHGSKRRVCLHAIVVCSLPFAEYSSSAGKRWRGGEGAPFLFSPLFLCVIQP